MRPKVIALVPLAAVFTTLAQAACGQTIRGAGARPCADWNQARAGNGHDYDAEQWTLGYLSGVNAIAGGQQVLRGMDEKTILASVDGYCGAHRRDMIWSAVKAVLMTPHGA